MTRYLTPQSSQHSAQHWAQTPILFSALTAVFVLLLTALPTSAHAAITCSISAPVALNFVYVTGTSSSSPNNKIQSAIVATCQRTLAGDPTTAVLELAANDGLQPTGTNNNAQLGANGVRYNLWRNAACTQQFRDTMATRLSATFSSTTLSPVTLTFDYWGCIPSQAVASFPAGIYTDSVTLFLRNGGTQIATAAIPVNISAPARCSISGGPGNITFVYNAFGAANFQSTGFNANCTNSLPYVMDVSPASGVVGGLRYELGLSDTTGSATNIGPASLSRIGSALGTRAHVVNGVMLANQAGDLGAVVPQPHTLTITY